MKYNYLIFSCFLFIFTSTIRAQKSIGDYEKILLEKENQLTIQTKNALVIIEFCTPSILRFRTTWNGVFEKEEHWMVSNYNWNPVNYQLKETEKEININTTLLQINIHKKTFAIQIFDNKGNLLSSEFNQNKKNYLGAYQEDKKVGTVKQLQENEHFFGFGERMDFLDRRGKKVTLNVGRGIGRPHITGAYNVLEANYSPIPFFMSTKGYGVFFHNAYPTTWDMGASNNEIYSFQAEGGALDYYFIYGPTFTSILDGYTSITGKSPLLPKFALGLHVGTYSGGTWGQEKNTSTDYVVNLAKKFRELQIPLDVLHLDSTWRIFGKSGGKGATTFEWRETFKNPEKMFSDLYDLNLNMVGLHLRPRFDNGKELQLLDEARKKGFVYPEDDNPGEFVNFFDQKSVDWWWDNGVKRVADQGAMFLKTDEGSAFGRKANESDKVGPKGENIKELHNLFPIAYAKAPYEKFQEHNGIRGMNHTREGYAGIQRYPFIFAGDWPSEWQYFEPVIKAGLNIGLSGVGNWSHCMGGFEHVADPELYIRWCQFGLLSPIAHLFGMEHPSYKEPWSYGDEAQRIFKQYDEMRYSLIPYLYSYSYEMYTKGTPLMRALVLAYQNDINVYNITDQYLLGESLMICPVTQKGAQTRVVYLPEGIWTDYWTGKTYEGKKDYNVLCPIDQLPIFVKQGAIIPTQELINYVGEKEMTQLTLDVYPNASNTFTLYNDDGKTLDYKKGKFNTTLFISKISEKEIEFTIEATKGKFKSTVLDYIVRFHLKEKPNSIKVDDKIYELDSDKIAFKDGVLSVSVERNSKEKTVIVVK
ncbi:glycoside hydrolase family 31 protein [Wenyingzhuangia sp. chi5]|uniref:Glycoside hydrolase family 31 protein n=1 Tax=Wenyingzhuangia gilva TaxID=3057677 RepID=A0ABT8VMR3_9FLAO|nr:TIM-barrel domain-containing protein [Wenyingzhuangia sp. chi5]MDO3693260.1 glycoside hydrolase family 31 protein [Wenyingzhuangia sp. chi5]